MNNADMPAMPAARERDVEIYDGYPDGLTKREYFAGLAMQAILSNHELGIDYELESIPESSVQFADALLTALEKDSE